MTESLGYGAQHDGKKGLEYGSGLAHRRRQKSSVVLGIPGGTFAIEKDCPAGAIIEQQDEVLPVDRLSPPFVLDDPHVLDGLDPVAMPAHQQGDWCGVIGNDRDRLRRIQGS